jgi:hypothetical protein
LSRKKKKNSRKSQKEEREPASKGKSKSERKGKNQCEISLPHSLELCVTRSDDHRPTEDSQNGHRRQKTEIKSSRRNVPIAHRPSRIGQKQHVRLHLDPKGIETSSPGTASARHSRPRTSSPPILFFDGRSFRSFPGSPQREEALRDRIYHRHTRLLSRRRGTDFETTRPFSDSFPFFPDSSRLQVSSCF